MKFNRIVSALLATVTVVGTVATTSVSVSAEDTSKVYVKEQITSAYQVTDGDETVKWKNEDGTPVRSYTSSQPKTIKDEETGDEVADPVSNGVFATLEEKLSTMVHVKDEGEYEVYYEPYTGEVTFVLRNDDGTIANYIGTNPYDINDKYCATKDSASYYNISESIKKQLLSQIRLTYIDTLNDGKEVEMYSYEEAAERGQITMKNIKNGIRVEYAMGEPAVQRLVPRLIDVNRYIKYIREPMEAALAELQQKAYEDPSFNQEYENLEVFYKKLDSYMTLYDPFDDSLSERQIKEMQSLYPITKTKAVYACDSSIDAAQLRKLEVYVKKYCPLYTYEELEYDNQDTGYVSKDQNPPRFTLALEYTVTENGEIDVRLPANGIAFDETLYQLQEISILPYMGAGNDLNKGYTFLPDGSGTIIRYEDFHKADVAISGLVYGEDNAYHDLVGGTAEEMRLPVFGAVNYNTQARDEKDSGKEEIAPKLAQYADNGFLAIITEGDSMATLTCKYEATHPYRSVYASFTPRPSDKYNLGDSISVTEGDAEWTVTSSRRYTGSYNIRYILLGEGSEYGTDYYSMAEAYRNYLTNQGVLEKIETPDEDIPLFIESFGSTTGTEKVLSFPVTVDIPLTTFEDVKTMSSELKESGIKNINFKLTGFSNGGLDSTMPYKLKWESVLGGSDGFEDLVSYASENNVGVYPEFDFAYVNSTGSFDGVSLKQHAVKTIDGRYSRQKTYDAGYQTFVQTLSISVSPSVYDYFYSKFSSYYNDYSVGNISVSTLGSDLNSDFDEDDPYHREDSKKFTIDMLEKISADNENVMVSGGNAYALQYADVITDVSLTSSDFARASESVPFMGIVLHGSKVITGTPINMEGDISEAILQAIENGASIYFTLSYENTKSLKSSEVWSKYYSIAYENWKEDVIKYYNILNEATADLQNKYIVGHSFIDAVRTKDEDEALADDEKLEAKKQELIEEELSEITSQTLANKRATRRGETIPYPNVKDAATVTAPEAAVKAYVEELNAKYKTETGSVVLVEYEGGVSFVLNYNSYGITVEVNGTEYTVDAMGFCRIG